MYFAEKYNEDFNQIAQKSKGQTFYLALVSIEISHFLIRYFHLFQKASLIKSQSCSRYHLKNMMKQCASLQNSLHISTTDDSILTPLNELHCHTVIFIFNYWFKKKQTQYLSKAASFGSQTKASKM